MITARRGFSLIELAVAMVLVGVATTALAAATVYAQRNLNRAYATESAARAAALVIDSLVRSAEVNDGSRFVEDRYVWWTVDDGALRHVRTVVRFGAAPADTLVFDAWIPGPVAP